MTHNAGSAPITAPQKKLPANERAGEDENPDTAIVVDLDADRKQFLTLQANYALAGFELYELGDGSLLATRWGLAKPLPDLRAAREWLLLVGGRP